MRNLELLLLPILIIIYFRKKKVKNISLQEKRLSVLQVQVEVQPLQLRR